MFTVYIIESLPNEQFIVHAYSNVVSGTFITGVVTFTLVGSSTVTFASRNPFVVTRAWDGLVPNPA